MSNIIICDVCKSNITDRKDTIELKNNQENINHICNNCFDSFMMWIKKDES